MDVDATVIADSVVGDVGWCCAVLVDVGDEEWRRNKRTRGREDTKYKARKPTHTQNTVRCTLYLSAPFRRAAVCVCTRMCVLLRGLSSPSLNSAFLPPSFSVVPI